ncbi:MAG: zinc-ribbon domain-containing protein [Deltaproteobacteria bacterium]|nr:zinc-ribbon domain-containing protein [Deltaproteobacteria bacterium]
MKFLCGNCKAKYKIADDKVSGRALRMKCRRCQHDIIIRREEEAPSAAAAAGGARGGAARPKAPHASQAKRGDRRGSALGAEFRRSVSSPGAKSTPPPTPAPPEDLWHVAINDVPVGPIKREEVDKKIQTGAVNGESLCWREGYDDWRPLSEVAELASLLRKQRPPAPSRRQPVGRGIDRRHESRPRIRPVGAASRPAPVPPPSNVVPIGGRLGGTAAPSVDFDDDDLLEEPTRVSDSLFTVREDEAAAGATVPDPRGPGPAPASVPPAALGAPASVPPAADPLADMFAPPAPAATAAAAAIAPVHPSAPPPARRKRAIPVGAWIAIVAAGAFGITLAVFVGTNLMRAPADPAPVAVATVATAVDEGPEHAAPEVNVDDESADEVVAPPGGDDEGAAGAEPGSGATSRRANGGGRRAVPAAGGSTTTMRALSAEQQALLDRMGGSGSAGSNIVTAMSTAASMAASGRQLTSDQLRGTITSNRRSLQRCYELAIRGAGQPPTIRLDVEVTIAGSGRVTRVNASGSDFGGMKACLESNVRRWRFPAGGATTQTQFPVVFQPQG